MRPPLLLPLLLWLGGRAATSPDPLSQLPAPQNLKIHLYNAEQALSWEPVSLNNDTRPVTYRVQYKYTTSEWDDMSAGNCSDTTATWCSFTAAGARGFPRRFNVSLRVQARLGGRASAWAVAPWFQHYRNVTIGPPKNIEVDPGKGPQSSLVIRFSAPFDIDDPGVTFWYYIYYEEKDGTKKDKGPLKENIILLDGLKPLHVYCLQVRAELVWAKHVSHRGQLSSTSCHETTIDAATQLERAVLISVGTFVSLFLLMGACFFLVLRYKSLVKYWFHTPPKIPLQIEEYLKDPAHPILEALEKDSSPKEDVWDPVSVIPSPEEKQEDILQSTANLGAGPGQPCLS